MKIRISDFISNFLVKKKFSHIFGITGGGAMHLNESFGKNKNLDFIFFHHEQSALEPNPIAEALQPAIPVNWRCTHP